MRVIRKDLVRDRIDQIPLPVAQPRAQGVRRGIAREVELDEVLPGEGRAVDGVLVGVLVEPGGYDFDVKDGAGGCADWVGKGLEGGSAEVEGEATEGGVCCGAGARGGCVGVGG